MLRLPSELVYEILKRLDPESRFTLASTTRFFYTIYRTERFPGYLFMEESAPSQWQRIEAVAHEGTVAQQESAQAILEFEFPLSITKLFVRYKMLTSLQRYFPSHREKIGHLSAACGVFNMQTTFPDQDADQLMGVSFDRPSPHIFELFLTAYIHGYPSSVPILNSKFLHSVKPMNHDHIDDEATCIAAIRTWLLLGDQPYRGTDRAFITTLKCPLCPPDAGHQILPKLPLLTLDGCDYLSFLNSKFKMQDIYPISCDDESYFCYECSTYQIRCRACDHFCEFTGSVMTAEEGAEHCNFDFTKLTLRAKACPIGLPINCTRLWGDDGGYGFNWRCTNCHLEFATSDK